MVMTETLNKKARERYEARQAARQPVEDPRPVSRVSSEVQEKVLFESLFFPQRLGGARSKSTSQMPFAGRTAGIYIPEWLRVRLLKWVAVKLPDRKVTLRQILLLALYEVSKGFSAPDEEAQAIQSLETSAKDVGSEGGAEGPQEPVSEARDTVVPGA